RQLRHNLIFRQQLIQEMLDLFNIKAPLAVDNYPYSDHPKYFLRFKTPHIDIDFERGIFHGQALPVPNQLQKLARVVQDRFKISNPLIVDVQGVLKTADGSFEFRIEGINYTCRKRIGGKLFQY